MPLKRSTTKKVLTDRQIAELYLSLARHYKDCVDKKMSPPKIYNQLANGIHYALKDPNSSLSELCDSEQQKIYNILNTFFYATPQYRIVPPKFQCRAFFNNGSKEPKIVIHNYYHTTYYQRNDDFLFNWLLINQLNARPNYGSYPHVGYSHRHQHDSKKSKKDNLEALAFLVLIVLAAAVAVCATIALAYMLSETIDSFERCFFNEGWMQASMNLLSMAVATTACTLLAGTFASAALFSLAVAAGVANPIAWVTFGIGGLGIIGGALGHLVSANYIIKESSPDALDPQDPSRFTLTEKEALALEDKGIDPIKVKCAIIALRAEIGDKPVAAFLTRLFKNTKEQKILSQIRALRSGQLTEISVGEMIFNCRSDALNYIQSPPQPAHKIDDDIPPPQYEQYQYSYDTSAPDLPPTYNSVFGAKQI